MMWMMNQDNLVPNLVLKQAIYYHQNQNQSMWNRNQVNRLLQLKRLPFFNDCLVVKRLLLKHSKNVIESFCEIKYHPLWMETA
jgi:hypothetical protein